MARHVDTGRLAALVVTMFNLAAMAEPSIEVAYCASINTASTSPNSSIYQSEGLCYDHCNEDGYALGILQDSNCWCSDYVPAEGDQVSTSNCESACPGYPSDYCGGDDLYGYIKLDADVSGTQGGTTSTATSTSSSTSTSSTVTTSTSESIAESTSSATTTSSPKTTSESSTPTVVTSIQTVTSEGSVTTQTIVTTAWPSARPTSGLSKGAIAGIVIGVLAAIAAFIAGALLYRRHRKNQQQEQAPLAAAMAGSHRRGSSAGIMSKTGTISSSGCGLGMEEEMSYNSPGRRVSMKPMDPRLDPTFALFRTASHDSINTIRDDTDYSRRVHAPRVMRVTNPDLDEDD